MHSPADFDDFYTSTRERLLLQAFALTGDLPVARRAVRDAYVAAWHHWRKVSRLTDMGSWVRPQAWNQAQRRHAGRVWHRDRGLAGESRKTLEALSKLSRVQRRALVLAHLSTASPTTAARELGLPDQAAREALLAGTDAFSADRGIEPDEIGAHLAALAERTAGTRFSRPSMIRRGGDARRRMHTTFGLAAAAGALVVSGVVVHQDGGATPALDGVGRSEPTAPVQAEQGATAHIDVASLLTDEQVSRGLSGRSVGTPRTTDNTTGDGINTACQRTRFADKSGLASLVRTFPVGGEPATTALQTVELSADEAAAARAYRATLSWYTQCQDERAQLIQSLQLDGVGDEGMMIMLHTWDPPVRTWLISVVRSGQLVTTVVRSDATRDRPEVDPWVTLTAQATRSLCASEAAGACPTGTPTARRIPPLPAPDSPGFLQVIDLPPVRGVDRPWVATDPVPATTNLAATQCDNADFTGAGVEDAKTRSFVVPGANLSSSFGLTETLGRFSSEEAAEQFLATIEQRMAACEDEDPAAEVEEIDSTTTSQRDQRIWRVTIELSEEQDLVVEMALVQRGPYVVQLGFVRDGDHVITQSALVELALRAASRINNLQS